MPLPRPSSPRVLWADLKAIAAEKSPHQWAGLAVAVAMPLAIVIVFSIDGRTNIAPRAQIIYVESWNSSRTDAEIVAQQKKDQAEQEALMKERQREWQKVDKKLERLGI